MQYHQKTAECTTELIEYQLEATTTLEAGKLRDKLIKVITGFKARSLCGRQISPTEVMTRIEKVFVKMGKLKTPTNYYVVKMGIDGPTTTALIDRKFGLTRIYKLNPVMFKEEAV